MTNVGEDVGGKEPLFTTGGNVISGAITVEISLEVPTRAKNRTTQ